MAHKGRAEVLARRRSDWGIIAPANDWIRNGPHLFRKEVGKIVSVRFGSQTFTVKQKVFSNGSCGARAGTEGVIKVINAELPENDLKVVGILWKGRPEGENEFVSTKQFYPGPS